MKIYVVNYKETTNTDNFPTVESGVCEIGYEIEDKAIAKCWELSDEKMNEFLEELETNSDNCYRDSNENGDWQLVHNNNDFYEYWVTAVEV